VLTSAFAAVLVSRRTGSVLATLRARLATVFVATAISGLMG
jgi:hypothetical protein